MENFKNRLKKKYKKLAPQFRGSNVEAFRLYHRDIPEFPFYIDLYSHSFVCWDRSNDELDNPDFIQSALQELPSILQEVVDFKIEDVIIKKRKVQTRTEKYQKEDSSQKLLEVQEGKLRFLVNLNDYMDTGLFLDHRPLRQWLSKDVQPGETCLNLFSYTCSLGVAMAYAGGQVTNVDINPNYLDWANQNFILNHLQGQEFIQDDVSNTVKELFRKEASYNWITLDPPSFSNSKRFYGTFDINRDQDFLIKATYELLAPGGTLFFSTNSKSFRPTSPFLKPENEITEKSIPVDFKGIRPHRLWKITRV